MPVRDALKRLVAERALDVLPNRTVAVPPMSRARFQEILQIRLSLESMITLRAATRIGPQEIELMAADHRRMCDAVCNIADHAMAVSAIATMLETFGRLVVPS